MLNNFMLYRRKARIHRTYYLLNYDRHLPYVWQHVPWFVICSVEHVKIVPTIHTTMCKQRCDARIGAIHTRNTSLATVTPLLRRSNGGNQSLIGDDICTWYMCVTKSEANCGGLDKSEVSAPSKLPMTRTG